MTNTPDEDSDLLYGALGLPRGFLPIAELRMRETAKGTALSGLLSGMRVLVVKHPNPTEDGPSHVLLIGANRTGGRDA